ncbi:MAG: hypothetical protein NC548_51865 [Lachnospiraceae bacterium]|nr:hypothetical protein [Lachnospiraceae bacterium]
MPSVKSGGIFPVSVHGKERMELTEGQAIDSDSRIVELLELLTKNQMNAQAEQVKQVCEYVGTLEQQLSFMTEEIKSVRKELVSMKEDTISRHVKKSLQKTADTLQKQCDSLKQQIRKVKENICGTAGKIVDAAKQRGRKALYKITQITGMRKKLAAIKDKVDRAIDRVDNLEKAVEKCRGQQEKTTGQEMSAIGDCVVAEPQREYGAELFEQYLKEHGTKQAVKAAGQTVRQEVEKSR